MTTRRSTTLAIAYSPTFKRQSAFDAPIPAVELTKAFPASSRNYLAVDETIEEVFDCTGEDTLSEIVTGRIARLDIDFDFDPTIGGGMFAAAYGVAAAPTGGTNEVQTITVVGTGGDYKLRVTANFSTYETTALAFDAVAADIQAALEALPNVGAGGLVVTGAGPFVATAGAALANKDLAIIIPVSALTGPGAGVTVDPTTQGAGRTHPISRIGVGLYQLPLMTFYVGFRGSDKQPVIFKNAVVASIRVRSSSRQKVTASLSLVGSADLQPAVGFAMPACQDITPVRFGDCAVSIGGVDYMALNLVRDFEYVYDNAVPTGDAPFTGQGIDITRLERGDRRPSGLTVGILGEPGDPVFELAKARTQADMFLRIGPAGNNVQVNVPQGQLRLENPQIRFEGETNESVIRLNAQPRKVSGDATTPSNITAQTSQAVAYLTAA